MVLPAGRFSELIVKYKYELLAAFLVLYVLPVLPYYHPGLGMDDSWKRALNMAVHNGLVFGKDFIFTYGPLGFLDTRDNQEIHNRYILAADAFLVIGYYRLLLKYLLRGRWWWVLLVFAGLLFLKEANYLQKLIVVVTAFSCYAVQRREKDWFEVIYITVAAAAGIYIKFNYGIVLLMLGGVVIAACLLAKRHLAFASLACFSIITVAIALHWKIALPNYLANSMEIARYYSVAMNRNIDFLDYPMFIAFLFTCLFAIIAVVFVVKACSERNNRLGRLISVGLLSFCFFFFYKSSFTRADAYHYLVYHISIPFFMLVAVVVMDGHRKIQGAIVVMLTCVLALIMVVWEQNRGIRDITWNSGMTYALPFNYFMHMNDDKADYTCDIEQTKISKGLRDSLGNATIDVIPTDIASLDMNKLNYYPRPIPQTYSVNSVRLDSLNAAHFNKPERPKYIFIANQAVDVRYATWDESYTKATIRLHYRVEDSTLHNYIGDYMLLKSKDNKPEYPVFRKIKDTLIKLGDTVHINFASGIAVYLSADIEFNLAGKLASVFFNFPNQNVTLLFDDTTTKVYQMAPPLVQMPVLISKAVVTKEEFTRFYTGELSKNRNVTGFVFKKLYCYKPEVHISYYQMINY